VRVDPIDSYRRATTGATTVLSGVRPDQLALPTPCSEWTVQDLIDHMTGSTEYLNAALAGRAPTPAAGTDPDDFGRGAAAVLAGLEAPDALDRVCLSPLGFEWPVSQAVMGTVMDTLIHTWDLAVATGQTVRLDPELVGMCIDAFLPEMPERGRESGFVGPAVAVPADAPPHVRLLAAMGRTA
jgi:uncharacterized protein (TIGR03086 family)